VDSSSATVCMALEDFDAPSGPLEGSRLGPP